MNLRLAKIVSYNRNSFTFTFTEPPRSLYFLGGMVPHNKIVISSLFAFIMPCQVWSMAADRYVPGTPNVPAATGIGRPRLASHKLSERSKSRETTCFFFSCGDRSGFFLQRFCLRNPGIKMHVGFTSQKCILIFFYHKNSRKRAYVLYIYIYKTKPHTRSHRIRLNLLPFRPSP